MKSSPPLRNVFACLVHEDVECILDLVRNLACLDPGSRILLYNGGADRDLLDFPFPWENYGATVHPAARPMRWGRLHGFALDCMRFCLEHWEWDTLTVVDSDQLLLRPGYSGLLGGFLQGRDRVGLLSSSPERRGPDTEHRMAAAAHAEIDLWRPLLRRFADGESRFVHWTFWPGTVFTAPAAADLVRACEELNDELKAILSRSQVWASEEVLFPTLTALLGYEIERNPGSLDYVRFRQTFGDLEIEEAFGREDVYWIHPVPRAAGDPLRERIRRRFEAYRAPAPAAGPGAVALSGLPLVLEILRLMEQVPGWLAPEEADLLVAATWDMLVRLGRDLPVVEVGSYAGRATVVLASVVKAVSPRAGRVFSVDPHDGVVGAAPDGLESMGPTWDRFQENLRRAGVAGLVDPIRARSSEVTWSRRIGLLLIDGLHDYKNVARDFGRFGPHVEPGGYVAFHDYAHYYPGVRTFVDELVQAGGYRLVRRVKTLVLLQKA